MKFNVAVAFAALAVVLSVSAIPADPSEPLASETVELTKRRDCCKYATSGQWCGPSGCCLWRECIQWGNAAQCGSFGCCRKYNC